MSQVTVHTICLQVPQPHHSFLQGRHGLPADVRPDQPAEFPQRQELDEYGGGRDANLDRGTFQSDVSTLLMRVFPKLLVFSLSGQLQANAYCDNPDIVLVGTKADLRDLRDVHARQARELADRYG